LLISGETLAFSQLTEGSTTGFLTRLHSRLSIRLLTTNGFEISETVYGRGSIRLS